MQATEDLKKNEHLLIDLIVHMAGLGYAFWAYEAMRYIQATLCDHAIVPEGAGFDPFSDVQMDSARNH